MATSVRVDEGVKAELDRLQGLLQAETGERLSHSALLERLLRFAKSRERDFLVEEPGGAAARPEDIEAHLRRARRWGVKVDVTHIDRDLYGGDP